MIKPAWALLLLLALALGACSPSAPTSTVAPSSTEPSLTATPTSTATAIPSVTPIPTSAITVTPTPLACWEEGGEIILGEIDSQLLPAPLVYRVYLPPCYQAEPGRRYPVLYLIHGQSFTDEQWDRLGVDETADRLIADGELPPFIVVMPHDRAWNAQPDEVPFGEAVVEELIPLIDDSYRTLRGRPFRAIGGLSRGAGWAVHLGLSHWELFSAIGAHSLAVFAGDAFKLEGWLDAIPLDQMPRFYIDVGHKDSTSILNSTTSFVALLEERGIAHEWYLFAGYHDEDYWSSHIEQYLRWYTAEW